MLTTEQLVFWQIDYYEESPQLWNTLRGLSWFKIAYYNKTTIYTSIRHGSLENVT